MGSSTKGDGAREKTAGCSMNGGLSFETPHSNPSGRAGIGDRTALAEVCWGAGDGEEINVVRSGGGASPVGSTCAAGAGVTGGEPSPVA